MYNFIRLTNAFHCNRPNTHAGNSRLSLMTSKPMFCFATYVSKENVIALHQTGTKHETRKGDQQKD